LVEKDIGKCPLGKPRRWEDNIEMNIRGIGYEDCWHMEIAQDNVN
jgi:hypothetical protein